MKRFIVPAALIVIAAIGYFLWMGNQPAPMAPVASQAPASTESTVPATQGAGQAVQQAADKATQAAKDVASAAATAAIDAAKSAGQTAGQAASDVATATGQAVGTAAQTAADAVTGGAGQASSDNSASDAAAPMTWNAADLTFDQIKQRLQGSGLGDTQKMVLIAALDKAKSDPAALQAVLDKLKAAMGK